MKKFILTFFVVVGVIFTTLITGTIILALKQQNNEATGLPENMVLNLRIQDSLYEVAQPSSLLNPFAQTPMTVQQIVQSIDHAAADNRVKGLTVYLKSGQYGLAQIQEIRSAVVRFRKTGKLTLVFADTLGDGPAMGTYYLASAFQQIWMQPIGELAITGIGVDMPFGRDLLNKVGVEPQILHRGRYKSYPESLMRNSMSDDNREMTNSMLGDLYTQLTRTMAHSRGISTDALQKLIDEAPLSADKALVSGLIDSVGYNDDIDVYLEQTTEGAESIAMADYAQQALQKKHNKKHHKPTYFGYVTIEGTLMDVDAEDGFFGSGVASAEAAASAIDEASQHPRIRALIVRVNSPGGSPIAAEIIRRAIVNASTRMPVIVSMSDAAASGGYWLSAPATKIVAQPATLTGSIGVFGGKVALNGLWDKLGVNWQEITLGRQAGIWSPHRPYNASEQQAIEESLGRVYDNFIQRVAQGRHLPEDKVLQIAEGRVWTGKQALKIGLVDALGGVSKAVELAKQESHLKATEQTELVTFPEETSAVAQIFKMVQRRLSGSEASASPVQFMTRISAVTGLPVGDIAPLMAPQSFSTYSFVRVR